MATHTQASSAILANTSQSSKETSQKLKWRRGNAKLRSNTIHLSIPAGWTCLPWATECLAMADKETGKITDGKDQQFRCYAASMEARYPAHRKSLWHNYNIIKNLIHDPRALTNKLKDDLFPQLSYYYEEHQQLPKVRIFGTSGDFFHVNLYKACLDLAREIKPVRVYWYTKAIPLWVQHMHTLPPNLVQNASIGGRYDKLVAKHNLKYALVVYSFSEAKRLKLPIDKRDELASEHGGPFAIPLHGTQPKGSNAARALARLKKKGFSGYTKRKTP